MPCLLTYYSFFFLPFLLLFSFLPFNLCFLVTSLSHLLVYHHLPQISPSSAFLTLSTSLITLSHPLRLSATPLLLTFSFLTFNLPFSSLPLHHLRRLSPHISLLLHNPSPPAPSLQFVHIIYLPHCFLFTIYVVYHLLTFLFFLTMPPLLHLHFLLLLLLLPFLLHLPFLLLVPLFVV